MNGKKITMISMDISKEKEIKERKEKEKKKERQVMDLTKIKERDKVMGKGEANYVNPSHSSQSSSRQAAAVFDPTTKTSFAFRMRALPFGSVKFVQ